MKPDIVYTQYRSWDIAIKSDIGVYDPLDMRVLKEAWPESLMLDRRCLLSQRMPTPCLSKPVQLPQNSRALGFWPESLRLMENNTVSQPQWPVVNPLPFVKFCLVWHLTSAVRLSDDDCCHLGVDTLVYLEISINILIYTKTSEDIYIYFCISLEIFINILDNYAGYHVQTQLFDSAPFFNVLSLLFLPAPAGDEKQVRTDNICIRA